jgi:hypothetical protein
MPHFTETVNLGNAIVSAALVFLGVPAWRLARRQYSSSVKAEKAVEAAEKAAEQADEVRKIVREELQPAAATITEQLNPSNGRTVAQVGEDTNHELSELRQDHGALASALGGHLAYSDDVIRVLRRRFPDIPVPPPLDSSS